MSASDPIDDVLFPGGRPSDDKSIDRILELYKIMVSSSEALVARRQGVNTFFLTINGAVLTAVALFVNNGTGSRLQAAGIAVLTLTGGVLSLAWNSLIQSFGQLNKGKFEVINRIEQLFPAAVYFAEWKALEEGKNPKKYRTFTSREIWTPWSFFTIYCVATVVAGVIALGLWHPS